MNPETKEWLAGAQATWITLGKLSAIDIHKLFVLVTEQAEEIQSLNRAVEVVEQKRDEWQAQGSELPDDYNTMVCAANEILAELKGEG